MPENSISSAPIESKKDRSCFEIFVRFTLYPIFMVLKFLFLIITWVVKFLYRFTLIRCFIWCVGGVLALSSAGLISIAVFPFILACLLVLRLCQIIKHGEEYKKIIQLKSLFRWFLLLNWLFVFIGIAVLQALARDYPRLGRAKLLDLSLKQWGTLIFSMLVGYGISFLLSMSIARYMPRMTLEHSESGLRVTEAMSEIFNCLVLWYFVSEMIPYFNNNKILGLITKKWIGVILFVIIVCNIIALITHVIVWLLWKLVSRYLGREIRERERTQRFLLLEGFLQVNYLVYYSYGFKRSINFILCSLVILLVWVLYIGSNLVQTNQAKRVIEFGTLTSASVLILSFLWLLKDFVLLSWEANTVYKRLSIKMLEARRSLYFLGIIGRQEHDIFKLRYGVLQEGNNNDASETSKVYDEAAVDVRDRDEMDEFDVDNNVVMMGDTNATNRSTKIKLSTKKRDRAKKALLMEVDDIWTLYSIQQLAQYYLTASNAMLKETYTSDIVRMLNTSTRDNWKSLRYLITGQSSPNNVMAQTSSVDGTREDPEIGMIRQSQIRGAEKNDWDHFQELLKLNSNEEMRLTEIKSWIERAHNNCLFLANTLRSAKEVVDGLNKIFSVLLIGAMLIIWLLFTRLATTEVLVFIASPLLAATFIFGDTCKDLFKGIIFVYVVHPLDVGDLCIIDDKMLEVKAIGIWITTFSKVDQVGSQEVIYPNSELVNQVIVNHKTDFDWNDCVEFNVECLDNEQINKLKLQIEQLLDVDEKGEVSMANSSNSVAVTSSDNPDQDMKLVVRFKHNKRIVDMTYFQCLKEKEKQRTTFILQVQNLMYQEKGNKMLKIDFFNYALNILLRHHGSESKVDGSLKNLTTHG